MIAARLVSEKSIKKGIGVGVVIKKIITGKIKTDNKRTCTFKTCTEVRLTPTTVN